MRSRALLWIVFLLAVATALPSSARRRRSLDLVEVIAPAGYLAFGSALSDNGRVVGELQPIGGGETRGFLAFKKELSILIPLPGGLQCGARDVNAKGQVVGYSEDQHGFLRGVVWTKRGAAELPPLPHADVSEATSINAKGAIGGSSDGAVVWSGRGVEEIGLLPNGSYSIATAINKKGDVVGHAGVPDGHFHAFIWSKGDLADLGTLEEDGDSIAVGINDGGEIAGYGVSPNGQRFSPVVWRHRQIADLVLLPEATDGFVHAINNQGKVAGASGINGSWRRAVVWDGGEPLDLNTLLPPGSTLELLEVYDINNKGDVLVQGLDAGRPSFWVGRLP